MTTTQPERESTMNMPSQTQTLAPDPLIAERENARLVDLIERHERDDPFCDCGSPNTVVAHGDSIWLECGTQRESHGLRGLIARTSYLHTRRRIVDLNDSLTQQ